MFRECKQGFVYIAFEDVTFKINNIHH